MNVAFCGASSTGKTTLIQEVANALSERHVQVISGVVRAIIGRGFPMGKFTTTDSLLVYIGQQFLMERQKTAQKPDILLSDRTLLDGIAYASANADLGYGNISPFVIDALREIWILEASRYDLYVYCPIEFPLTPDGVRDDDEQYRIIVDKSFRHLLEQTNILYITATGTIEDRTTSVLDAMR